MHAPADILGHLDQMVGQSHGTMIERSADRTYAVHLRGCTSSWATGTQRSRRQSMAGSSDDHTKPKMGRVNSEKQDIGLHWESLLDSLAVRDRRHTPSSALDLTAATRTHL